MKLILCRHGEAEDFSKSGRDKDRELSEKGIQDIQKVAKFIRHSSLNINYIYYSPYRRTTQTSTIIQEIISNNIISIPTDNLLPDADYVNFLPEIKQHPNSAAILVIGHNPNITNLGADLIRDKSLYYNLIFLPGTTLAINVPRESFSQGQIIWMLSPNNLNFYSINNAGF